MRLKFTIAAAAAGIFFASAAFAQDISVGRGRLVAFLQDPTERAMWPGLYKALLNAMIVGSAG